MKQNFEVSPYCSNRFYDKNQNLLSRLQISMANAINKNLQLPNAIVLIFDKDLIEFLKFTKTGVAQIYGTWLEWLAKELSDLIIGKIDILPSKALKPGYPSIYWVNVPNSKFYDDDMHSCITKFNLAMESVARVYDGMRVVKLKEYWNVNDMNLVHNNALTFQGLSVYWKSIDAAIRFNITKREEYRAKETLKKTNTNERRQKDKKFQARVLKLEDRKKTEEEMVRRMFKRRQGYDNNHITSSNNNMSKFLLPRYNR